MTSVHVLRWSPPRSRSDPAGVLNDIESTFNNWTYLTWTVLDLRFLANFPEWGRERIRTGWHLTWADVKQFMSSSMSNPYLMSATFETDGVTISLGEDCLYISVGADTNSLVAPQGMVLVPTDSDPWKPEIGAVFDNTTSNDAAFLDATRLVCESGWCLMQFDWAGCLGGIDWIRLSNEAEIMRLKREVTPHDYLTAIPPLHIQQQRSAQQIAPFPPQSEIITSNLHPLTPIGEINGLTTYRQEYFVDDEIADYQTLAQFSGPEDLLVYLEETSE
jgi:hypothetical protein